MERETPGKSHGMQSAPQGPPPLKWGYKVPPGRGGPDSLAWVSQPHSWGLVSSINV